MDSGDSSSSMQSSSSGDEEYEPRPESIQALLNTPGHFSPLSNPHPSVVSSHQDHPPTFFDPSANYLNPFFQSQPSNSVLNLDGIRPRSRRSEPNRTVELGNLQGSSSSSSQAILGAQGLYRGSYPSSSSMQSRPSHDNGVKALTRSDQKTVVKKRSRASRTASTTVLTTDTTNFRAIVQEFTGNPAPPFLGSSYSRRLDLFGCGSGTRSSHLERLGSYSLPSCPSAKRVKPTPSLSSSCSSLLNNPSAEAANITNATSNSNIPTSIAATTNALNPTSSNYQLPSDLGVVKQAQNMLNLQNQSPILSFQSFLQLPPLQPSLNLPVFAVKSQGSSAMPSLDELGLNRVHVNANIGGLQSHLPPDGARLRSADSNWRDGVGLNDGNQDHLRSLDGNYDSTTDHNSQRDNSCKLNDSSSPSCFQRDKGLENVSSRAEGRVDSWICPTE